MCSISTGSNIQLSVDRGDGFNGFMNIGKATVKGVELSVRAAVTEHWHAGGQFTYTDGKITELGPGIAATGTVAVGDAVPAVPRVSTSGFLEWYPRCGRRLALRPRRCQLHHHPLWRLRG